MKMKIYALVLTLLTGIKVEAQTLSSRNIPIGQKIFPTCPFTSIDDSYYFSMDGANNQGICCNSTVQGCSSEYQDINLSLINDIFHTSYSSLYSGMNPGTITWEVFNDHQCAITQASPPCYSQAPPHSCHTTFDYVHKGIDYRADYVDLFFPFQTNGVVKNVSGTTPNITVTIYIQEYNVTACFLHMSQSSLNINDLVQFGTQVGVSGQLGTAKHFHLEVRKDLQIKAGCTNSFVSDTYDPRALYVETNYKKINDGLDIYAGTLQNPKTVEIFFTDPSLNGASFNVQNCFLKYYKSGLSSIPIPANAITVTNPCSGSSIGRFSIDLSLVNFNIAQDTFTKFDIGFQVTHVNTTTPVKFFGYQQVYILDPNDLTDALAPKWFSKYVTKGVDLGLFRGISKNSFSDPYKPFLTRGQAAKVIVTACEKLGLLSINITGNDPPGLKPDSAFYMYMKTLFNTERNGIPVMSQGYPSATVTAGQFAKMVVLGFDLSSSDVNKNLINHGAGVSGEKITLNSSDPSLQPYIDIANGIAVLADDANYLEFTATPLSPISSSMIASSNILVNSSNEVSRSLMAKYITLTYKYKLSKLTSTSCFPVPQFLVIPPPYSKFTIIGEKYELADNPTGSINLSTGSANIDMEAGEVKDFGLDDETLNGYPLHFYWCVDSGQLVSLFPNNNHKKVRFTAPNVTAPTPVTLYLYIGCGNGMAKEAIYNITVYPQGQVPQPPAAEPTQSPSSLGFSNTSYYQTDESWTTGDGDYTLVTYTPQGSTVHPPVDGAVYSLGSTIAGNTKVTYSGTGNTDVTGSLQPGTTYQFRAYSFNGNTTGSTNYKTTSPASGNVTTLAVPPFNADFYWDDNPVVAGQSVEFTNTVNASGINESWTFQSGTPPTSTQNNPDVVFASAGSYLVTLTATNTNTNQVSTVSKYVPVLAANAVNPDFVVSNLSLPATTLYAGQTGISTNITFSNIGLIDGQVNNYRIYLSSNAVYDAGDTQIGIRTGWASAEIPPGQSLSTTHNITIPGGTATGTWYILVYADFENTNVEVNEGNNVGSVQVTVEAGLPDFTYTALALSRNTVATYDTLTITSTLKNQGFNPPGGSSYVSTNIYISSNNTWEATDTLLTDLGLQVSFNIPYSNQSENLIHGARIPANVKSGNYYIIITADIEPGSSNDNMYAELNEANNYRAIPVTISNPTQPTIAPTNIQIQNITPTTCRVAWTSGNGAKRMVVFAENQTAFYFNPPFDKTTYTANSNYTLAGNLTAFPGQGKIIYSNSGNYVDVTNLTPNTTYTVNVFEYNGSGSTSDYLVENYLKPVLFKTSDTAQTPLNWQVITNSPLNNDYFSFRDIQFLNDSVGYACDVDYGIIASTKSGGSYWQLNKVPNEYFSHVHFLNATIGIVAGSNYTSSFVYTTDNGGSTWSKTNFPNAVIDIEDIYMLNSSTWFVVALGVNPDTSGYLYRTIDGGNTFQLILTTANSLRGIDFVSQTKGFVCGSYRRIYTTNDVGLTWSLIHTGPSGRFNKIDFVTDLVGYAIKVDSIYKTTNGGYAWIPLAKASTIAGTAEHIAFYNANVGYVTINSGEIAKTTDGGTTWSYFSGAPFCTGSVCPYMYATSPISENKVWVAGDWIYNSTTGGLTYGINKPTLSLNPTCTGFSMQVTFTKTGTFNAGNVFTVQLSDSAGNFNTPLTLGTLSGVNAGTVTAGIPNGTKESTTYRIRVVSSNPVTTSSSSDNLTVYQTPTPSISALLPLQYNLGSSPVTLSSYGNPPGGTFRINGNTATVLNPASLGLGTHTVRYHLANGPCLTSAEKTITVIPTPQLSITNPTPNIVCPGSSITFNYTSVSINPNNTFSVQLSDKFGSFTTPTTIYTLAGNNTSGTITATIPVIAPMGNGYKIRLISNNPVATSANSSAFTIDTLLVPTVSIQPSATNICEGQQVTFTASIQNGGTTPSYQWKLNGIATGANSPTYTNAQLNNQDEISLTLTSNAQCALPTSVTSQSTTIQVNQNSTPGVYIVADDTAFCSGTIASFSAYSSNEGNAPVYMWKVNGVPAGNSTGYFSSSTLSNNDKVSVILTSSEQCLTASTATDSLFVNILQPVTPTISISTNNPNNCNNQLSSFTATTTNASSSPVFVWKQNGIVVGTNSSSYNDVFLTGGETIVCELISSACASPNPVTSNTITVPAMNFPAAIGQPQGAATACMGDTLTYTASAGGSTSIVWSVNNGTILSGQGTTSVSIVWQQTGNNAVTVVGSNVCGSAIVNQVKMVNVGAAPDINISTNSDTVCDNTSPVFTATVANPGTNPAYQWKLNGLNVGTGTSTYTLPNPATGNTISCVFTSINSCSVTPSDTSNTISITTSQSPAVPVIAINPPVWCGSNPTYLETSFCTGCNYQWSQSITIPFIGTILTPIQGSSNSIPVNVVNQGYNVNVTVTNTVGCSATGTVVFNSIQQQNATSTFTQTTCQNVPFNFNGINLSASGVYYDTLSTTAGCDSIIELTLQVNPSYSTTINETICNGTSYLFNGQNLTTSGTYTQTFTATSGCDSIITLHLLVDTAPSIPVVTALGDTSFCQGESVVLQTPDYNHIYLWNDSSTTTSITVSTSGLYYVMAANQCGTNVSNEIGVTVFNLPAQPSVIQNDNTLSSSVAAASYQWYLNQSLLSSATTQSIVAAQSGNYEVEITDANGCKSTSAVYPFVTTGVNELETPYTVQIIPNPNNGQFTIQFTDNIPHTVSITDLIGRVLWKDEVTGSRKITNETWANGVYLLNVVPRSTSPSLKFVITR